MKRSGMRERPSNLHHWSRIALRSIRATETLRLGDDMGSRLPVLDKFITELRAICAAESENGRRMERAKHVLERFVMEPSLKARSASWPSTEGHKNLLLYVDPDHHFVINAVVRMPGRTGSVHDHADAWVLYGMLDGTESLERYDRLDDGSRPGHAEIKL